MKKLTLISFLFLINIYSNISIAESKVMKLSDLSKDDKYSIEFLGKEFTAKEDNSYLLNNSRTTNGMLDLKAFLKSPDSHTCSNTETCIRKSIYTKMKFKVINIVSSSAITTKAQLENNSCEKKVIFCYYQLKFEDGDTAYMQIYNFHDAESPLTASALKKPALLQITPTVPNKRWLVEKKYHDKIFRKIGVNQWGQSRLISKKCL